MTETIERVPINSLLQQDSKSESDSIEDIISDIQSSQISTHFNSELHLMEDAYVRRFPSLYALKYKPIKSKPLTFMSTRSALKNRPWQRALIDDQHPNKVIEKSRQLGLSELSVTETIWFLDTHENTKIMYTFPRSAQMVDFSNTRVAPVFRDSAYLTSLLSKEVNNVTTKKIGSSYLFMRSSWDSAIGEGADTDGLVLDEYDRMKDGVEFAFQEGLKSSQYGLLRRFSTPTIPGRGINMLFQKSDQMRYIHTCPHCGHKQFLTADDNIIQIKSHGVNSVTQEIEDGTFIIGCKKCKRELDRWATNGEWVPLYPSIKETRGYHISQMDATWITADDIMRRKFSYSSRQLFYNYVLGEPYSAQGLVVTEGDVRRGIRLPHEVTSRTNEYVGICAGVDWGGVNWMVILGLKSTGQVDLLDVYWVEDDPSTPLRSASYFAAVLRAYNPNLIICDFGYGADRNSYMYTQFPQSLYACKWQTNKDSRSSAKFIDTWNDNTHEVTVDKTVKMQRVLHTVKAGMLGFFQWNEKLAFIAAHLNNVRIVDEEDNGVLYQIATRIGPDHSSCCLAYAFIGIDKLTGMGTKIGGQFSADFM